MRRPHRNHPGFWAFALHRASGVALVLFLPLHFLVLGLALESDATLDGALAWSDSLPVKAAELLLVLLLAGHLLGGLRILAIELLPWLAWQRALVALVAAGSLATGALFLARAL